MAITPYASRTRPVLARRIDDDPAATLNVGNLVAGAAGAAQKIVAADREAEDAHAASEHRLAVLEAERARAKASADFAVRLAESSAEHDRWLIEHGNDADFDQQAPARIEQDMAQLRGMLGNDPELHNHLAPVLARTKASRETAVLRHAAEGRARAASVANEQALTTWRNNAATSPERTEEFAEAYSATQLANPSIPAALRPLVAKAGAGAIRQDGLAALIKAGRGQAVAEALNAGTFDASLPEGAKAVLLNMAEAQGRTQERMAEGAQAAEQAAVNDAIAVEQARLARDPAAVDVATVAALIARGKAAGLKPSELQKAEFLIEDASIDQSLTAVPDRLLADQVLELGLKRSRGEPLGKDARWLDRAEAELKERDARIAGQLQPLLKGGVNERLRGIAQMAGLRADQRERVAEMSGDSQAALLAGLSPPVRAWAVQGRAARKDRDDAFLPPKSATVKDPGAELDRQFDRVIGPHLKRDLGASYGDLRDTALDVMAARGGKWNPHDFGRAVQVAFGMTRRADGTNQGGLGVIGGNMVELPDKWTQGEFDRRLARYDFAGAVTGGGVEPGAVDIRRNFRPEYAGPGEGGDALYRMIGPDGRPLARRRKDGTIETYLVPVPERP